MKNRWILEVIMVLMVMAFVCYLGTLFLETVHQENVCWANGYETPINYLGECYCFGKDGQPEITKLSELEAAEANAVAVSRRAVSGSSEN